MNLGAQEWETWSVVCSPLTGEHSQRETQTQPTQERHKRHKPVLVSFLHRRTLSRKQRCSSRFFYSRPFTLLKKTGLYQFLSIWYVKTPEAQQLYEEKACSVHLFQEWNLKLWYSCWISPWWGPGGGWQHDRSTILENCRWHFEAGRGPVLLLRTTQHVLRKAMTKEFPLGPTP